MSEMTDWDLEEQNDMATNKSTRRNFIKLSSISGLAVTAFSAACSNAKPVYQKPEKKHLCFLFQCVSITEGNIGRKRRSESFSTWVLLWWFQ